MQLVPPQILKNIIDNNISNGIYSGIWKLSFCYLLAVLIAGIADLLKELMMAIIGQDMLASIRYNMAKKLQNLPISYFSNNSVGETMSYFTSDVDSVGTLFTSGLIGMISDTLKAIGIIISIYILSPKLALYSLIIIPIIYFITKFFKKATFKAQMETRQAVSHINGFIQEVFNGIRTLKIFKKEKSFLNKFQEPLSENINAVHKTSLYDSLFPCMMQVFRAIVITVLVAIASPSSFGITVGAIAAVIDLISRMLAPIEAIAMEFQTIQQAASGMRRIKTFEEEKEEIRNIIKDQTLSENPSIEFENSSFSYDDGKEIIKNISFNVKPGSKVAIIGRTGAGKSTILNLAAGLYKPNTGSIKIGGLDPFFMEANLRRKYIGIVPQISSCYDGTIREAITLYDDSIISKDIEKAAKIVGLHDDIIKLKDGYDTLIGEGECSFSNGEYQLLSLASALVLNPPILLLDEVTSGLDRITEERIFNAIKNISKNRTILTISHRISGFIDSDEIIIIENGEIVEVGSPKTLINKDGWYSKYYKVDELGWKI